MAVIQQEARQGIERRSRICGRENQAGIEFESVQLGFVNPSGRGFASP